MTNRTEPELLGEIDAAENSTAALDKLYRDSINELLLAVNDLGLHEASAAMIQQHPEVPFTKEETSGLDKIIVAAEIRVQDAVALAVRTRRDLSLSHLEADYAREHLLNVSGAEENSTTT